MIEPHAQLHGALAERVARPREVRQRQSDERGIDRVELVLETTTVPRRPRPASRAELGEQRLAELKSLRPVDAGARCTPRRLDPGMMETRGLGGENCDHVAQRVAPSEMSRGERDELRPARHPARGASGMVRSCKPVEIPSREHFQQLGENGINAWQDTVAFGVAGVCSQQHLGHRR